MRQLIVGLSAAFLLPVAASAYTVTANQTVVRAGETISADWTAPSGHSPGDWISFYAVGDTHESYGQHTTPSFVHTSSPLSGTVEFALSRTTRAGRYEYRYLLDDGYSGAATSAVRVLGPCEGTTIEVEAPSVVVAGDSVAVSWRLTGGSPGTCAQSRDWVALFPVEAPDTTSGYGNTIPAFVYTSDEPVDSALFIVPAGTPPGRYELRYFQAGAATRSAASQPISVLEPGHESPEPAGGREGPGASDR